MEHGHEGNIKMDWEVFFFLDKFVLKTWISSRVSYFVSILCEVRVLEIYFYQVVLKFCPY